MQGTSEQSMGTDQARMSDGAVGRGCVAQRRHKGMLKITGGNIPEKPVQTRTPARWAR